MNVPTPGAAGANRNPLEPAAQAANQLRLAAVALDILLDIYSRRPAQGGRPTQLPAMTRAELARKLAQAAQALATLTAELAPYGVPPVQLGDAASPASPDADPDQPPLGFTYAPPEEAA